MTYQRSCRAIFGKTAEVSVLLRLGDTFTSLHAAEPSTAPASQNAPRVGPSLTEIVADSNGNGHQFVVDPRYSSVGLVPRVIKDERFASSGTLDGPADHIGNSPFITCLIGVAGKCGGALRCGLEHGGAGRGQQKRVVPRAWPVPGTVRAMASKRDGRVGRSSADCKYR